ncbi:hypothetical protein RRG08_055948 [Elysia crispata]|uniref:Apyrase n=1 Tax=Elysia crispata TaxID=231223 RepID=A0AAE0Z7E4_9GAST|nr:hypothetical protein RRG08_055948 [Elysia crispata]
MIVRAACIAVLVLCVRAPVGRSCPLSDLDAKAEEVFTNNETQTSVSAESYGVLLDAGSSSTKLKIYKWKKPNSTSSVPNVTLVPLERPQRKFKPGLADIEWGVVGVQTYLLNILQIAQGIVPADQHAETPVFVLATAGFRLLGVDGAREGMENVEEILLNKTLHPFRYTEGSASVLSGEEEGAYAWIAANYLLGFFHDNKPDEESVGVLEMGGGSTQIAFIPRDPLMAEEFQVIMAGRSYSLYVQSYLQFGLNAIRKRLEHKLVSLESCALETADQPCMLDGDSKNITACGNLTIQLQGTGNPAGCQKLYDDLVATAPPQKCYLEPCAIGSVFQPSVKGINFYAISSFVYSLKAAGAVREDETLDLDILWSKAEEYCLQDISKISSGDRGFASANCMEAIYTNELLTKPYGFEKSTRRIKVTSKINGNDIEWALGAMLEFLSLTFTGDPSHLSLTRKLQCKVYGSKERARSGENDEKDTDFENEDDHYIDYGDDNNDDGDNDDDGDDDDVMMIRMMKMMMMMMMKKLSSQAWALLTLKQGYLRRSSVAALIIEALTCAPGGTCRQTREDELWDRNAVARPVVVQPPQGRGGVL